MTQLVALVFHNTKKLTVHDYNPDYRMVKLLSNGATSPMDDGRIEDAIRWVESKGYIPRGYWIHNLPALVWAPHTWSTFETIWRQQHTDDRFMPAPCQFTRKANENYTNKRVGTAGYLVPTRTRLDIYRLRQQFPTWEYQGDLAMVPLAVLYEYKDRALASQNSHRSPRRQKAIIAGRGREGMWLPRLARTKNKLVFYHAIRNQMGQHEATERAMARLGWKWNKELNAWCTSLTPENLFQVIDLWKEYGRLYLTLSHGVTEYRYQVWDKTLPELQTYDPEPMEDEKENTPC